MHDQTQLAFLIVFALLVAAQVVSLYTHGQCVQCGGKAGHRENCPRRK